MDKKRRNEQTEFYQFKKEPSYNIDLSPCQVLESGNEKCGLTDRRTSDTSI